ncbi:DUF1737 domain-containing protein [Chondrinema litorale]|uniref:DUF1737 domain-containing protein n=1 Tax=Chondrinema litorale TaxID=2994555 RepID=UPI002543B619|nr:DUF1737 domain-containing protein [Chondrinema litorale]UZR93326.1 DUF1737 domain-containing protein [Chondrinema litorale]
MSKKVVDYKIISSSNPKYVEKEVKRLLAEGWELQGGISIGEVNRGGTMDSFCQAVVKYEE